ncbi:MAG: hypothetical protein IPL46_35580 [Saprospiraceae bacterium]|nr:hypothetical protein [Saprospiraceae bacterium]
MIWCIKIFTLTLGTIPVQSTNRRKYFWPIEIEKDWRFEFITYGIIDLGAQLLNRDSAVSEKGSFWEEKTPREPVI